eukprot:CAMPEP_0197525600 /NCGR_PEP_ID=MMETSP1318-20131121/13297_1 /TAXON_ID=552666 /ORGANISM="Partenskyella glossopodia, Strain RCC365" /LENGTH=233 /DNA_ID=CAMNT_0043079195 /DNA_START=62 /DNA_END=763 /DNA_ORIENTATION=+
MESKIYEILRLKLVKVEKGKFISEEAVVEILREVDEWKMNLQDFKKFALTPQRIERNDTLARPCCSSSRSPRKRNNYYVGDLKDYLEQYEVDMLALRDKILNDNKARVEKDTVSRQIINRYQTARDPKKIRGAKRNNIGVAEFCVLMYGHEPDAIRDFTESLLKRNPEIQQQPMYEGIGIMVESRILREYLRHSYTLSQLQRMEDKITDNGKNWLQLRAQSSRGADGISASKF